MSERSTSLSTKAKSRCLHATWSTESRTPGRHESVDPYSHLTLGQFDSTSHVAGEGTLSPPHLPLLILQCDIDSECRHA
jgi:hypothetical protein